MPLGIQLCLLMSPPSRFEVEGLFANSSGEAVHVPANLDSLLRGTAPPSLCHIQQGTLGRQGRES